MSKRDGKMYIANRLNKKGFLNTGQQIDLTDDDCAGALFAFWTKTAAKKRYGRNVDLIEIEAKK